MTYTIYVLSFGLSYTTFSVTNVEFKNQDCEGNFKGILTNFGNIKVSETLFLYLKVKSFDKNTEQNYTKVQKLNKKLIQFLKFELNSQENIDFNFFINSNNLELISDNGDQKLVNGDYILQISNGHDIQMEQSCTILV